MMMIELWSGRILEARLAVAQRIVRLALALPRSVSRD